MCAKKQCLFVYESINIKYHNNSRRYLHCHFYDEWKSVPTHHIPVDRQRMYCLSPACLYANLFFEWTQDITLARTAYSIQYRIHIYVLCTSTLWRFTDEHIMFLFFVFEIQICRWMGGWVDAGPSMANQHACWWQNMGALLCDVQTIYPFFFCFFFLFRECKLHAWIFPMNIQIHARPKCWMSRETIAFHLIFQIVFQMFIKYDGVCIYASIAPSRIRGLWDVGFIQIFTWNSNRQYNFLLIVVSVLVFVELVFELLFIRLLPHGTNFKNDKKIPLCAPKQPCLWSRGFRFLILIY